MLVTNPVRTSRPDPRVLREAQSLIANGYDVTVVAWDRAGEEAPTETVDGVDIVRIQSRAKYGVGSAQLFRLPRFWWVAARRMRQIPWDCVHCHDLDTLPVGYVLARLRRRPVVFDSHESYPDYVAPRVPGILVHILRLLERALVRRVTAVITVGDKLAEKFTSMGARAVVVVGNWHDPDAIRPSDEEVRRIRRQLGIRGLMVSYAGSFGRNRALLELIEAVENVAGVNLVLAGDGGLRPLIERRIKGNDAIVDLGVISYAEALRIKAASDVVYRAVHADRTPNAKYSAPNNLFEALASGVAVIGGSNGDIGQIIGEERCGIALADVTSSTIGHALETLKNDGVLDEMRKNALAAARRQYNWSEASRRLLDLYRSLC